MTNSNSRDGIVTGTDGNNTMLPGYIDANGDRIDGNDAILPGTFGNDDVIVAGDGNDCVDAGLGNDKVYGGAGNDTLTGGAGNDTIYGDSELSGVTVGGSGGSGGTRGTGGSGGTRGTGGNCPPQTSGYNDLIYGGDGNDVLYGEQGNDKVYGGAGNDTLSGGVGANYLEGGAGDDLFIGGAGADTFQGNAGQDNIDYSASAAGVTVNLATSQLSGGDAANDQIAGGIDGVIGSNFADSLTGFDQQGSSSSDTFTNQFWGNGGNDTITGAGGNDQLYGGNDADKLYGGLGNDLVAGDAGADTLEGGEGNDTVTGGTGDDLLTGGAGNDSLTGGDDRDLFVGGNTGDFVDGSEGGVDNDTLDLRGLDIASITYDPLNGENGTVTFVGGGTMVFRNIETVLRDARPDGYVDGTAGGDLINGSYVDPNGDRIDANDALLPGAGPNDDYVRAGDGNDTVYSGLGNDIVFGGNGMDLVYGGDGSDALDGGEGNDTLQGGSGADSITGGNGNDNIDGGTENDTILAGDGSDVVAGGDGNDVIDTSTGNPFDQRPDQGYPGLYPADTDPNNDRDTVDAGAGDDIIRTGDDADKINAGTGNDWVDAGVDNDTVDGGDGNDTIIGAEGSDSIDAGKGNDLVYGGYGPGTPDSVNIPDATDLAPNNGLDLIHGGDGNDTIFGMDDKDTLFGDAGADSLDGGIDNDEVYGGTGADTLVGGQGADTLSGGNDRDVVVGGGVGDVVDGNEGGDDFDTLDLSGSGPLKIIYDDANPENGTVQFLDPTTRDVVGTMSFVNIENVIPCFTPGTMIATPRGEVPVESLRIGDKIITRDNGMQEIRWMGRRDLSWADLSAAPHLKPILVRQGSLGNGLPERDMLVSPNHRLLVANDRTALYFDEHEVLVAAKHLAAGKGIHSVDVAGTSYIHFMCDRHEVVLSNGAWTESFQPGDLTLKGMGNAQRSEIFDLFPELKTDAGIENYAAARRALKRHEALLIAR